MSTSDEALTQVGHAVGFQEFRTFQRTFKKLTGLTLREFKQAVRAFDEGASSRSPAAATPSKSRNVSLISNQLPCCGDAAEVKFHK